MKIEALDKNGFQCNNGYIENISKIQVNKECLGGNIGSQRDKKSISLEYTGDQYETNIQRTIDNIIENIIDIQNNEESIVKEIIYDNSTCSRTSVYDIFDNQQQNINLHSKICAKKKRKLGTVRL